MKTIKIVTLLVCSQMLVGCAFALSGAGAGAANSKNKSSKPCPPPAETSPDSGSQPTASNSVGPKKSNAPTASVSTPTGCTRSDMVFDSFYNGTSVMTVRRAAQYFRADRNGTLKIVQLNLSTGTASSAYLTIHQRISNNPDDSQPMVPMQVIPLEPSPYLVDYVLATPVTLVAGYEYWISLQGVNGNFNIGHQITDGHALSALWADVSGLGGSLTGGDGIFAALGCF